MQLLLGLPEDQTHSHSFNLFAHAFVAIIRVYSVVPALVYQLHHLLLEDLSDAPYVHFHLGLWNHCQLHLHMQQCNLFTSVVLLESREAADATPVFLGILSNLPEYPMSAFWGNHQPVGDEIDAHELDQPIYSLQLL